MNFFKLCRTIIFPCFNEFTVLTEGKLMNSWLYCFFINSLQWFSKYFLVLLIRYCRLGHHQIALIPMSTAYLLLKIQNPIIGAGGGSTGNDLFSGIIYLFLLLNSPN